MTTKENVGSVQAKIQGFLSIYKLIFEICFYVEQYTQD